MTAVEPAGGGTVMVKAESQSELYLAPRAADEILVEKLGGLVAEFNEHHATPERRIELFAEIQSLRARLRRKERAS